MNALVDTDVSDVVARYSADRTRLLDMLWDVQDAQGYLTPEAIAGLAHALGISKGEVIQTASFYHFFATTPAGRHRIYLSDSVLSTFNGYHDVRAALEKATGATMGGVSSDGMFGLYRTPCIGLSDQEPAMLIDWVPFTRLRHGRVEDIIEQLRQGRSAHEIANPAGQEPNSRGYIDALVETNVHTRGPAFFAHRINFEALIRDCLIRRPEQVIEMISESRLRGRGGAGFSTGLKWQLCRAAPGERKHIICNADEGEPGTFKDRALLMRSPKQVFMGMVVAAYAIGATSGLVYLRAEYRYLREFLEARLQEMRDDHLLGRDIGGYRGFDFDIRIQIGAGAYVCGEESALIESLEGKRGTPRLKPPFPAQAGYLDEPTCIDNVESFAAVTKVVEQGPAWFADMGTVESAGTRLLSVAGDCRRPGIYEIEWGTTLGEVLALVGARDAAAVQVGGPSGECVNAVTAADRRIAFEDLNCNGAFTIFDSTRDLISIARDHLQFFVEESCGICVPCRSGNVDLRDKADLILAGRATQADLSDIQAWGAIVRASSRCGLGATSPKPLLTSMANFPQLYADRLAPTPTHAGLLPSFDHERAMAGYDAAYAALNAGGHA